MFSIVARHDKRSPLSSACRAGDHVLRRAISYAHAAFTILAIRCGFARMRTWRSCCFMVLPSSKSHLYTKVASPPNRRTSDFEYCAPAALCNVPSPLLCFHLGSGYGALSLPIVSAGLYGTMRLVCLSLCSSRL